MAPFEIAIAVFAANNRGNFNLAGDERPKLTDCCLAMLSLVTALAGAVRCRHNPRALNFKYDTC